MSYPTTNFYNVLPYNFTLRRTNYDSYIRYKRSQKLLLASIMRSHLIIDEQLFIYYHHVQCILETYENSFDMLSIALTNEELHHRSLYMELKMVNLN